MGEASNYNSYKEVFVGGQKDMLFVSIQFFWKKNLEDSLKISTRLRLCKEVPEGATDDFTEV